MKPKSRKSRSIPMWSLGRWPRAAAAAGAAGATLVLSGCNSEPASASATASQAPTAQASTSQSSTTQADRDEPPVILQNAYDSKAECEAVWGEENCTDGFNPSGSDVAASGAARAQAGGTGLYPYGRLGMGRYLGPRYFFDHLARAAYMIRPNGAVSPVPTRASQIAMSQLQSRGALRGAGAAAPSAGAAPVQAASVQGASGQSSNPSVTRGGFGSSAHASSSGGG